MIVGGYPATGKTTFANQEENNMKEVPSMPYAWVLPSPEPNVDYEAEKAARYHVRNLLWPTNMLLDVLKLEREYGCVIIPTVSEVIKVLQEEYGREVVLCYPAEGLQEEYRRRFEKRGNTEDFIELFVDHGEFFLAPLKQNEMAHHIVLKSGEYISDHWKTIKQLMMQDKTSPVSAEKIQDLEDKLEQRSKNVGLTLLSLKDSKTLCCMLPDLRDENVRRFVYKMGRKLDTDSSLLMIIQEDLVEELERQGDLEVLDRTGFEQAVDAWVRWKEGE